MRRWSLFFPALLALPIAAFAWPCAGHAGGVKVVELYTSEGCNPCGAADAELEWIAAKPGVIALSFHVAWWDYLGRPDPFALKVADDRQREYLAALGGRTIYTPQFIIQGERSVGGGTAELARVLAEVPSRPAITLAITKDGLTATIPRLAFPLSGQLWLIALDRSVVMRTVRQNNPPPALWHVDVVRWAAPVASVQHTPARLVLPTAMLAGHDEAVVIMQPARLGKVLVAGAIRLPVPPPPLPTP